MNKHISKSMLLPVMAIFLRSVSLTTMSCRDKCSHVICVNDGVCSGGSCTCPSGYEGATCQTVSRQKFLGNWTVFEKGSRSDAAQYSVSVLATDDRITNVAIYNFNNFFTAPILGVVSGNTLTIPNQKYQGKIVYGAGTIGSSVTYDQFAAISISYAVTDSATNLVDDYGYFPIDKSDASMWNK